MKKYQFKSGAYSVPDYLVDLTLNILEGLKVITKQDYRRVVFMVWQTSREDQASETIGLANAKAVVDYAVMILEIKVTE